MSVVYRIENLTKIYKGATAKANDGLTFDIHEGEVFGLLGPNGAGKSTLVSQVAGLITPTSGSLTLYGSDIIAHPDVIADYVAVQPQISMALWDLSPPEAIYHTGRFRRLSAAEARKQTNDLMEELQMTNFAKTVIRKLSGGQRRLVNLAVAFVGQPPILIFDEPTNDLDPVVRRTVWDKLLGLKKLGTTIILVTHNVLEAERVIQRVGIINHGRLMALGTPGELKARVDQRVRLELLFKTEANSYGDLLAQLGDARPYSSQHWTVLCHRGTLRGSIDQVLARIGLEQLDDFRILTPSLEDVYMQLGGGAKLA